MIAPPALLTKNPIPAPFIKYPSLKPTNIAMESIGKGIDLPLYVTKRVESERESSVLTISVSCVTKVNFQLFSWADNGKAEIQ